MTTPRPIPTILNDLAHLLHAGEPFTPDQLDLLLEARDVMAGGVA